MAKGTSSRGSAHVSTTPSSLTTLLALPTTPTAIVSPLTDPVIRQQLYHGNYDDPISDRRRYQPDRRSAPPHAFKRDAIRLYTGLAHPSRELTKSIRFARPDLITICLRRKVRREVLHALRRTRKGSGGGRRRNFWSDVKC